MLRKFRLFRLYAVFFAGALISVLISTTASAAYPERPIRIIMPFAAGGAGDLIIRTLLPGMEKQLGKPVIVEYKLGAGGNIGTLEVVKSAPDGYTLLLGPTNNFVINQFLYSNLGFDPLQALAPVTILADTPYIVFINAAVPAGNFGEFSNYARANAGKLNYGSPGNATVPHLSAYMLSEALGWKMTHVPYRGVQPAVTALLAKDVQFLIVSYGITGPLVTAGKLRALAVAGRRRIDGDHERVEAGEPGALDARHRH